MYQYHKWLRSFHAVARTGSFTQAAELLSIGQPTISEQVSGLEKRFCVELFHRRGRFIELSPAGRQLYEITQGLFGQEDEAIQLLRSFRQRKHGMLRIGAVIWVEREGQKAIVIGKAGSRLKEISTKARLGMERLFDAKVFLETWVRVREGWSDDEAALKALGYGD